MGNITEYLQNDQSIVRSNATSSADAPTAEAQKEMGITIAIILAAGIGSLAFLYFANPNRRR